jgi:intracellular sulfur oxidation DsrE/DsrF family protein
MEGPAGKCSRGAAGSVSSSQVQQCCAPWRIQCRDGKDMSMIKRRKPIMEPNADQPTGPESKPGSNIKKMEGGIELVRTKLMKILVGTLLFTFSGWTQFLFAPGIKDVRAEPVIHIDIPVNLKKANVVFNMNQVDFSGDVPTGIKYMELLATRFKEMGTRGRIIGIFHGPAAYMIVNDKAYNAYRLAEAGNPYKKLLSTLIEQGVQIEACAVSMKNNGWSNEDLLPGVKVNAGAIGRLIQLVQEGYVQIQP